MSDSPIITPDPLARDVVFVPPTNNVAADTANLQAAIDALSYSTSTMRQGTLVLSGRYLVNRPLTIGDAGNDSKRAITIVGASQTELSYYGPVTDAPLLSFNGIGRSRSPRLVNVLLGCGYRCRGVVMRRQTYTSLMRDCYVIYPRQIGIDLVSCWGSSLDNVTVVDGRGILYRSTSGSMALRDCRFQGMGCWFGDGKETAKNVELNKFEMEHGRDAARDYFGPDYGEDWPAEDDQTVISHNGTPCATSDRFRAACVVSTGPQHWTNPIWEGCYYGSRPLMISRGPFLNIQNARFEGNYANVKFALDGDGKTLGKGCRYVNTHMADPAVYADCLLELRGMTHGASVDAVCATYLRKLVHATSGTHTNVRIRDVATWSGISPSYQLTACSNGATLAEAA